MTLYGKSLFGDNLRTVRTSRGRSIAWLAGRIGVSKSYLRDVEHGKGVAPDMHVVLDCARELHAQPFAMLADAIMDSKGASLTCDNGNQVSTLATLLECWPHIDVYALGDIQRIAARFRK
jgi:transcriptional regulator with XRE-family HTH domain